MDKCRSLAEEMTKDITKLRKSLAKKGISSPNANADVAKAMKKAGAKMRSRTPKGAIQVDKKALSTVRKPKKAKALAVEVLQARSRTRDRGGVLNIVKNSDGERVYPDLRMIGALTGRSSCATPNLQQLNKHRGDGRVRGIMRAEKGHVIVAVDYNNIEIRTIAELSQDKKLISRLEDGLDVHSEVAEQVYGNYTPAQRNAVKAGIFAMLYGAGTETIADTAGCDYEEAMGIILSWEKLYPATVKAGRMWIRKAERTGYAEYPNGWRPAVGKDSKGKVAGYRAKNYHVQGMAAFIFREGARQLAFCTGYWKYVRMVVHDEFVLSVPKKRAEQILEEVVQATTVIHPTMTYTTGGEIHGKYWGINRES